MLKDTVVVCLFICIVQVSVVGQSTRVTPAPLHVIPTVVETRQIDLIRVDFQEIEVGLEFPTYVAMQGEPPAGAQVVAYAQLFRSEAVRTARFDLISAGGRELGPLFFTKSGPDPSDRLFAGVVDVPRQPFRVRVTGVDVTGKPYSRTYARLFRPIRGRPSAPRLSPRVPPGQAALVRRMLQYHDQQTRKQLVDKGHRNPDGMITLPRAEISEATYEALMSSHGNVIGLRLRYTVRVTQDGWYWFSPWVWPIYAEEDSPGVFQMRAIAANVDPLPEGLKSDEPGHLSYLADNTYRAGKTYRFVVDTIPTFASHKAEGFCLQAMTTPWRNVVGSDRSVPYGVRISWVNFRARTDSFFGPGVFYRSFLKEGAQPCSEGGNINF